MRYWKNNFTDGYKQDAIDLFLGSCTETNVKGEDCSVLHNFWCRLKKIESLLHFSHGRRALPQVVLPSLDPFGRRLPAASDLPVGWRVRVQPPPLGHVPPFPGHPTGMHHPQEIASVR